MIKIEFPADRADIALAMARALHRIATGVSIDEVTCGERPHHERAPFSERLAEKVAEIETKHLTVHADGVVQPAVTVVQTAAGHVDTATGEVVELEQPASPGDAARFDHKGVAFDARYCANAQDPFYATGKKSGQWKCKRGVDDAVYDAWYAQQLAAVTQAPAVVDEETDPTPLVATGAAFGAVQPTVAPTLKTAGDFMAWVSEKQTAGKLTQEVINTAYQQLGVRVQDLFAPTPDNVVANNIAALHGYLSQTAGA